MFLLHLIIFFYVFDIYLAKSAPRVKEESVESFDGLYFDTSSRSSSTSSGSSSTKKTRGATRWPIFETWTNGNTNSNNNNNGDSHSSSSSLSILSNSHPRDSSPVSEFKSNSGLVAVAENIKCVDKNNIQSFTASITPPPGFMNVPVFEDAISVNPSTSEECSMKSISSSSSSSNHMFNMRITSFIKCGVTTQKANDGKEYLAVSIRFPFVGGLKTSDDEHVLILCRPQERTMSKTHVMEFRSNL